MLMQRYQLITSLSLAAVLAPGCRLAEKRDLRTKYRAGPGEPAPEAEPAPEQPPVSAPLPPGHQESSEANGEGDGPDVALAGASQIVGAWESPCNDDSESDSSQQGRAEFTEQGSFTVTVRVYNGMGCDAEQHESTYEITGGYGEIAPHSNLEDIFTIDYRVDGITLAMFGQTVETANRRRFCALKDWQEGEARDVTGLSCRRLDLDNPAQGTTIFDIFKVTGDALQIGLNRYSSENELDGSTADKRPVVLSAMIFSRSN